MFVELAHVSLFAGYGDLEAATTVEPVLSGIVLSGHPLLSGRFSKSRKLLLLMYCNFDLYYAVAVTICEVPTRLFLLS